jgi:hypothetical protein
VKDLDKQGAYFDPAYFNHYFDERYFGGGRLVVRLDGTAASAFGEVMTAVDLAEKITEYWNAAF